MLGQSVILATLFLGKLPGGNLSVFSVHSFVINRQLIFLNQGKRNNDHRNFFMTKSSRKNLPDKGVDLGITLPRISLLTLTQCSESSDVLHKSQPEEDDRDSSQSYVGPGKAVSVGCYINNVGNDNGQQENIAPPVKYIPVK